MASQFSVTLLYRHFSGGEGKKKEEAGGDGRGLRRGDGRTSWTATISFVSFRLLI